MKKLKDSKVIRMLKEGIRKTDLFMENKGATKLEYLFLMFPPLLGVAAGVSIGEITGRFTVPTANQTAEQIEYAIKMMAGQGAEYGPYGGGLFDAVVLGREAIKNYYMKRRKY